jgi:hypothetical protein
MFGLSMELWKPSWGKITSPRVVNRASLDGRQRIQILILFELALDVRQQLT